MKKTNLWVIAITVSSLFLLAAVSVEAVDDTITDGINDVTSIDYMTGESAVVTSSPYITVNNLDIQQATFNQQGTQVTLTLQVHGIIEDRGEIINLYSEDVLGLIDAIEYAFEVYTSEDSYYVTYSNQTAQLTIGGDESINLTSSDFSVVGDTLTISFNFASAEETYTSLSITTTYIKADLSAIDEGLLLISDVAPNPPLSILEAYAYDLGSVGESIQFNATLEPLTGEPPFSYQWDFGDEATSTQLNPTHTYTKAGNFTYSFTVTDNAGATESETGTIIISDDGDNSGPLSSQMILFLAVLICIIVIGVVIIVWIIRR